MKKDVLIKIRGVQKVEGDSDVVELLTTGSFCRRKDSYIISYDESEATGFDGSHTTLTYEREDGRVTMTRSGAVSSQLIIEKGKRHQCNYDLGFGSMTIGVSCNLLESNLGDDGGDISFDYSLDINTALTSENQVNISVAANSAGLPI